MVTPYRGQPNTIFMAKIKILNTGPANAYFINIKDMLPMCAEYVTNSTKINDLPYSDPIISGRTLIWKTNFNISAGGKLTLTFKFNVSDEDLIKEYIHFSPKISYEFIDPIKPFSVTSTNMDWYHIPFMCYSMRNKTFYFFHFF